MLRPSAARLTAVLVAPLVVLFASVALAPAALAAPQLDLPSKRKSAPKKGAVKTPKEAPASGATLGKKKSGNMSGGKVGEQTEEQWLYDEQGRRVARVKTTGQNVPGAGKKSAGEEGLDLPARPKGTSANDATGNAGDGRSAASRPGSAPERQLQPWEAVPEAAPKAGREAGAAGATEAGSFDPLGALGSSKTAARFLFGRLEKVRRISDPQTDEIADHLARLGDEGLRVARYCLAQDSDVLSYAGARTILISGSGADADRVVQRLRGKLPSRSGQLILAELIERDPVRASTPFLAQMLRHRSGSIRRVALKELSTRFTVEDVPLIEPAFRDRSTDVRKAATNLLAGLEDSPTVTERLLDRITDSSSSVSEIAIGAIARTEGPDVGTELLRRLFASGEIVKKEALLVVAIVEREDRTGVPLFGDDHLPALLRALDSPQPIVNASAALALAGLGFRSHGEAATPWLDGPVPSALVSIATGATFFDGYSLVREPALRRLRLISGVNYGTNGPDWGHWWVEHKHRFRADRAVITVAAGDERRMVLRVDSGQAQRSVEALRSGHGRPYVLAGASYCGNADWIEAEVERAGAAGVTLLFLNDGDAADLVSLLSEEGVFGSGRLPGPRGSFGASGRSFEIEVGGRSKTFGFALLQSQPWFDRIIARAEGLAQQNVWQRYPVKGVHADSTELFHLEGAWWAAPHTQEERSNRLLAQIAACLHGLEVEDREAGIAEMQGIVDARDGGAFPQEVVESALGLVAAEAAFGQRARNLTEMVSTLIESGEDKALKSEARSTLLVALHDQFGPLALDAIARVLQRAGHRAILGAAIDDRETLRVAAALNLGQGESPDDIDLLLALLEDPATDVEIAAIAGLAERGAERARAAIWARARPTAGGHVPTRATALRAVGMIGGTGAQPLLVSGLTDSDERFHLPAAQGMAALGTKDAAPMLVALLHSHKRQSIQSAARKGLLALGELGHDDLFSAMRSPDRRLQREAAVLLAKQLIGRSVPVLASTVALDPDDEEALSELAILTCVDYSDETVPAERYFQWWDEVDHNNTFSWFAAALEQRGLRAPSAEAFVNGGTEEGRLFLLTLVRELDGHLGTRALRELERLHGSSLGPMPERFADREAWFKGLQDAVSIGESDQGDERSD